MASVYDHIKLYKKKYKGGITWFRLKKHAAVIEKHLNPGEVVIYAFPGQKNKGPFEWFNTCVVALTNKRILIGQKRVVWGYFLNIITPDLYNDMQIYSGLLWGTINIDTVKEVVTISNLSKKALEEIETQISEYMMKMKKEYYRDEKNS